MADNLHPIIASLFGTRNPRFFKLKLDKYTIDNLKKVIQDGEGGELTVTFYTEAQMEASAARRVDQGKKPLNAVGHIGHSTNAAREEYLASHGQYTEVQQNLQGGGSQWQ